MTKAELGEFSLDRMFRAIELVHERLLRTAAALESQGTPYAICGGCAVAEWVARVDTSAVRFADDVDVLVRRSYLSKVQLAMEAAGFIRRSCNGREMFLDGAGGTTRSAVKIVFASEPERPNYSYPTPDVIDSERGQGFQVLCLDPLVRMSLTSFRSEDGMLLRDMLDVGLLDESWLAKLPADLAARLKELIDTPDG
jgi:hypothetical protein